jgi:hypothetical protein
VPLATLPGRLLPGASDVLCPLIGSGPAVLHGDPTAAVSVWLQPTGPGAGGPQRVIWPAGLRARFARRLELIDSSGAVVAREGDLLVDIGVLPGPDVLVIWAFNDHRYPCY